MNSNKYTQSTLNITFDFDNTNRYSLNNSLNTITQGHTNFTLNPRYSCRPIYGHSLTSNIFNPWKLQEKIEDCSRGEIARAYRLQRFPKGGF